MIRDQLFLCERDNTDLRIENARLRTEIERLRLENDMLRSLVIDAPTKKERDELFARRALEPKP